MTETLRPIRPQIGKRHVMRNGELTGVVTTTKNYQWPFSDGRRSWTAYGRFSNHIISKRDIIAVHEEPEAEEVTHENECNVDSDDDVGYRNTFRKPRRARVSRSAIKATGRAVKVEASNP